jgi:3-oxoacyl-(acyl-carrier-protein) synthase
MAPETGVESFLYQRKALKYLDRRGKLALYAAREAVLDSGLDCSSPSWGRGISLAVGGAGAGEECLREVFLSKTDETLTQKLRNELNPLWLLGRLPNMPASHLAIQFKARGPVLSSLRGRQALEDAMDLIENGEADVVLTGATEAWFGGPERAGLDNQGEAAVLFVMESLKSAVLRGADVYHVVTRQDIGSCRMEGGGVEAVFGHCGCAADLLALALDRLRAGGKDEG